MARERFAEEFRSEAVRQVVERGYTVADVAKRFRGIGTKPIQVGQGSKPHR